MKNLLILFVFAAATAQAQMSTVEQISSTIRKINQLLLTTPEIKPLLDEQAQLYNQVLEIERKTGIDNIKREFLHKEKEICFVKEKEIGAQLKPLREERESIESEIRKRFIQKAPASNEPALFDRITQLEKEINNLSKPYHDQITKDVTYFVNKEEELGSEQYQNILKRIGELRREIIRKIWPQAKELLKQLDILKIQLHKEKPCEWKEILVDLEKSSVLKMRVDIYWQWL